MAKTPPGPKIPPGAKFTPIEPSLLERVKTGVRYVVSGTSPDAWMSPGQPLAPQAQEEAKARQWDYPVGYNYKLTPRSDENVSFPTLRSLADGYDLLRLVIETRKDQVAKLQWSVRPKEDFGDSAEAAAHAEEVQDFLLHPDKEHDFDTWLRMLLEDLLVLDAPTLYPRMTKGGKLYALEPIDGATIKRVLDQQGRTPLPPDPAFQQVIKGLPAVDYSRDELIYYPRNLRTNRVYGYSPVEQVIMTVNIALRRQLSQLEFYSEGSTPDLIMQVPKDWTSAQIREFKEWWDSVLAGNTAARRGTMFVPEGVSPFNTKDGMLKDEYDEWLARIVCFAFSISPQPFVKQMNRATAETAQDAAAQEGLAPIQNWIRGLLNLVAWKYFGYTDIEFAWEEEESIDPKTQAEVNKIYLDAKVLHPDEVRADLGREPLTPEQKDDLHPVDPLGLGLEPTDPNAPPGAGKPGEKRPAGSDPKEKPFGKRYVTRAHRENAHVHNAETKLTAKLATALKAKGREVAREVADKVTKVEKAGEEDEGERVASQVSVSLGATTEEELVVVLQRLATQGGADALGGSDPALIARLHIRAIEYAKERAAELIGLGPNGGLLDGEVRDSIKSTVAQALQEGWSPQRLASELEDSYAFSEQRARVIARTEAAKAYTSGAMEGYREAGVAQKQWLLGPASCDICEANADAGPIPIDDVFPSGDDAAPAHPNCTCDTIPVEPEQSQEDTEQ